ncbi:MAG: hypothetical protein WD035_09095 [Balneolaceae bacterium]
MKRKDFLKNTFGASLGSLALGRSAINPRPGYQNSNTLIESISKTNDRRVADYLSQQQRYTETDSYRSRSGYLLAVSSGFCSEYSEYYRSDGLVTPMRQVVDSLLEDQNPDGTFDFGNLESPPDSAFMAEQMFRAQALLLQDGSSATAALRDSLRELLLNIAGALTAGGVHTPNHRWAISAALAGINDLYPDQKYVNRINDWLGEGLGQDEDGEHPERSRNYDASVNNPSLLDVAIYQNRPELFEAIRKNLELTMYLMDSAGELETVSSRRQDQSPGRPVMIHRFYLPFRYMAIREDNPRFAAMARLIETKYMDQIGEHLGDFLLHEELNQPLPEPVSPSDHFVKILKNTRLARIRRGEMTASVFGGTDWHLGHGVWSGLSHNPTFFNFRKGDAVLESVRMSPAFFRTGYFRSQGLDVDGNTYRLWEERQVPYHQPLPESYRNPEGVYKMSPDGRFYSKMDFENRPKDYKKLRSEVIVRELNGSGSFEMEILVDQTPDVDVTVELCFRKGGQLSGVIPKEGDPDGFLLSESTGSYRVGEDIIEFGPGRIEHTRSPQSNEQYAVHGGEIRLAGYRVYITGTTPFRHTLRIG